MNSGELVTLEVTIPKSQIRKVKAMLKKEGAEVVDTPLPSGMRKGNYKKGEKPSKYAGAWANKKKDNLTHQSSEDFRRKAWGNRGVSNREIGFLI